MIGSRTMFKSLIICFIIYIGFSVAQECPTITQNFCSNPVADCNGGTIPPEQGPPGKRGPRGEDGIKGEKGQQGVMGDSGQDCDSQRLDEMQAKINQLETQLEALHRPPKSCADLVTTNGGRLVLGMYMIQPSINMLPFYVYCNFTAKKQSVFHACEHQAAKELQCPVGHVIRVVDAFYGRKSTTICSERDVTDCSAVGSQQIIETLCNGYQSCRIDPRNTIFTDPCPGVRKYVEVTYQCVQAKTIIGHDSESEMHVHGIEADFGYKRSISYDATIQQITSLIDISTHCRQFIKWRCQGSVLNHIGGSTYGKGLRPSAWISRDGSRRGTWGGATRDNYCACGETGTCVDRVKWNLCNCDQNSEGVMTSDEGYLTTKDDLPVTQLWFGDTGGANEHGWHTLGKLECS